MQVHLPVSFKLWVYYIELLKQFFIISCSFIVLIAASKGEEEKFKAKEGRQ